MTILPEVVEVLHAVTDTLLIPLSFILWLLRCIVVLRVPCNVRITHYLEFIRQKMGRICLIYNYDVNPEFVLILLVTEFEILNL